mgnify:CR=1 FL=1
MVIKDNKVFYGYNLVSKNYDITGESSYIILESKLLQTINKLWYDNTYTRYIQKNKFDRDSTIIVCSFLDSDRRNIFIELFPQYTEIWNSLYNIVEELTNRIIQYNKPLLTEKNIKEIIEKKTVKEKEFRDIENKLLLIREFNKKNKKTETKQNLFVCCCFFASYCLDCCFLFQQSN